MGSSSSKNRNRGQVIKQAQYGAGVPGHVVPAYAQGPNNVAYNHTGVGYGGPGGNVVVASGNGGRANSRNGSTVRIDAGDIADTAENVGGCLSGLFGNCVGGFGGDGGDGDA